LREFHDVQRVTHQSYVLTCWSLCVVCRITRPAVAAWRSGNIVRRINEVTLHRARLVPGWLTVFGGHTTSVFHQATQANSASYPRQDGKWVPAKVRLCSAAGE